MIFRPVGPRIVSYGAIVIITVITIVIGVGLRDATEFTAGEWATLGLMIAVVFAGLHGIGRSYVETSDAGLDILNGYRRHHLEWSDIKGIAMNAGAPWPTVVLKDDERVIIFAIQGTDGAAAKAALTAIGEYIG